MRRFVFACALLALGPAAGRAEPMRCSGEYKSCLAACARTDRACAQSCASRLSHCAKTGCWQGNNYRACGLSRQ
jgi:hypothetical protein